jgi:hypothetical protein
VSTLFLERFPQYTFFLPQWIAEAKEPPEVKQIRVIPPQGAEVLYLYGLGKGILSEECWKWLGERPTHRIIFLEPEPNRMIHLLHQPHMKRLLEDHQIEIVHLPSGHLQRRLLRELSEKYPFRGVHVIPFAVTDDRRFRRVEAALIKNTACTHAHFLDRLHGHIPFSHLVQNIRHLPEAFYGNRLQGTFAQVPAVICGAGPSLENGIDIIRTLGKRALVIAGGSAIAALSYHGIAPHFALAVDPNPEEMERVKSEMPVPLLFSTRLFPAVLSHWKGPLGYIRSGMAGIPELWLEEELGLVEPILAEHLPNESFSVTTLAAAFAVHLGCNPILFEGVDLAYTGRQRYATGVAGVECKESDRQPIDRWIRKRDRHGNMTESAVRWVMEARALSRFANRHRDRLWVNCTRGGLHIPGMKEMALSEAVAHCTEEWDLRTRVEEAILQAPMPSVTRMVLEKRLLFLQNSLLMIQGYLDALIEGRGSSALTEWELREELSRSPLLFDAEWIIRKAFIPREPAALWRGLLELVICYRNAIDKGVLF